MRVLLLSNPAAGGGRGTERARQAERQLRLSGATVLPVRTDGVGHARRLLSKPLSEIDRVVACGGDGLVSEAAAALAGGELPLAIVPAGRGNDLARALALPLDVRAAAAVAVQGRVRRIDLGDTDGHVFCTVAACGLDAEVSRRARERRLPLPGPVTYLLELLRAVGRFPGFDVRVEHEGGVVEGRALVLAVANTATYGGGFRIAPDADVSDGLLDACLVRETGRLRALALFPSVYRGRHGERPEVVTFRTRRLEVTTRPALAVEADGEPLASTPAVHSCRPGALPVVVPA